MLACTYVHASITALTAVTINKEGSDKAYEDNSACNT